jgi:SEC-C motif-containing protein
MNCPCGKDSSFAECCGRIHQNIKLAESAEQLMRSRYSAFVVKNIDFLYHSFHPNVRRFQSKKEIEKWAFTTKWMKLEICKASKFTVEFKAYYLDGNLQTHIHHEKSRFEELHGIWYYLEGKHF